MQERRKGPDIWLKMMLILNLLAWVLFIASLSVLHMTQPEQASILTRFYQIELRSEWLAWVMWILPLSAAIGFCTFAAILINAKRKRRRDDQWHLSTWGLLATALGMAFYVSGL
ncbi:hypothetical protein [Balneatrix alpica]|uniref:NADH dehydrogenase subunit 6 n=1 Tax=Balneatrix alpica TaxID=75684 RepID=A0ABV5ZBF9_9GAMM|nr:hypothetical protein [Balneatrix alpica]